ncbi:MAG: ATP synthase F1 subunit epsilon [Spirochaetaceae bacterium]|jgi:F-type H+-transporting ATPase subunit epsilon|nr:ATP synthase F1 subunit epsilon [Spirochaetaceae bacterium]
MAKLYPFEVHTPYRLFYSDLIESLTVTLLDGETGVYADHSAFTAPVCPGILRFKDKTGDWKQAFIAEGFLEVKAHKTVLLADAAEWPEEIDYARALEAKKRAEERLASGDMKFAMEAAKADLRRAESRLKVKTLSAGNF